MARTKPAAAPSLRERKFARTKQALLERALAALERQPLEDIRVKDLCAEVEISEASFYNYFPQKTDLLVYYIELWSLEMAWHANRLAAERGGLPAIEEVFALTARRMIAQPNVMGEIIAFQARMRARPALGEVSIAERRLAFSDLDGIEDLSARDFTQVVMPLLEQAVAAGELPRKLDRQAALLAIAAIFFGVPVALRSRDVRAVGPAYRTGLRLLWSGLRARPARK